MNSEQACRRILRILDEYSEETHGAECLGFLVSVFTPSPTDAGVMHHEVMGTGEGIDLGVAYVMTQNVIEENLSQMTAEHRAKCEQEVRAMPKISIGEHKL